MSITKLHLLVVILLLAGGLSAETIVTIGPGMSYSGLQEAINAVINPQVTIDSEIVFRMYPGNNPYIAPTTGYSLSLGYPSLTRVTIEGYSETDLIHIQHTGALFSTVFDIAGSDLHPVEFLMKNLYVNSQHGYAMEECSQNFAYFEISNCTFITQSGINLGYGTIPKVVFRDNHFQLTSFVGILQPGWVDSLFIEDNRFTGYYSSYANLSGATYTTISGNEFNRDNDLSTTVVGLNIENSNPSYNPYPRCHIFGNQFVDSSIRTVHVICTIENNSFRDEDSSIRNHFIEVGSPSLDLSLYPVIIRNNLFVGGASLHGSISIIEENDSSFMAAVNISNNTFVEAGNAVHVTLVNQAHLDGSFIQRFTNNLFKDCSSTLIKVINYLGENMQLQPAITVDYSVIYPTFQSGNAVLDPTTCFIADPEIVIDSTTPSYQLTWTDTVKSPCINAGYRGDNNELTDPDGTPPDIGCVYYPHYNREYFDRVGNIEWLSFPVLDDRSITGDMHWDELRYLFDTQMMFAPNSQLNQIQWSYDGEASIMSYNGSWYNSDRRTTQAQGYKVQFNQVPLINNVTVNGFKVDADNTPAAWIREVEDENEQVVPFENWIGYYVPFTQGAGLALSRVITGSDRDKYLDYIYSIQTRTWSTKRLIDKPGSPWIIDPNKYTLTEGEMVSLLLLPGAPEVMYWFTEEIDVPEIIRTPASAFDYEEKLDYTPVFIEFDPEDLPDEVGVYVDGVCKGAAVVDSSLIEVCFYNDTAKDGAELEIMFYYEGKGKQAAKGWTRYNPDSMVFENGGIDVNNIGNYAYISFRSGEGESPVPLVTVLQPNYPNPFNPSTSISFILGKDMDARLDIYNLRGQRVKTLCNTLHTKGKHAYVWTGQDDHGRQVASGIYFSRLSTLEGNYTQKMMLMK